MAGEGGHKVAEAKADAEKRLTDKIQALEAVAPVWADYIFMTPHHVVTIRALKDGQGGPDREHDQVVTYQDTIKSLHVREARGILRDGMDLTLIVPVVNGGPVEAPIAEAEPAAE